LAAAGVLDRGPEARSFDGFGLGKGPIFGLLACRSSHPELVHKNFILHHASRPHKCSGCFQTRDVRFQRFYRSTRPIVSRPFCSKQPV
jgi:hypothetical protein